MSKKTIALHTVKSASGLTYQYVIVERSTSNILFDSSSQADALAGLVDLVKKSPSAYDVEFESLPKYVNDYLSYLDSNNDIPNSWLFTVGSEDDMKDLLDELQGDVRYSCVNDCTVEFNYDWCKSVADGLSASYLS